LSGDLPRSVSLAKTDKSMCDLDGGRVSKVCSCKEGGEAEAHCFPLQLYVARPGRSAGAQEGGGRRAHLLRRDGVAAGIRGVGRRQSGR
jgi:hypothetical protein